MSIWSSRTKMEHAKTRSIVGERKANGHDEEEELDEIGNLEKTIDLQKKEGEAKLKEIQYLHAQLKDFEGEIVRLRRIIDNNNVFMQQIILELINKPAVSSSPLTSRREINQVLNKPDTFTPTAGPIKKLP